jgi:hypothetical protein
MKSSSYTRTGPLDNTQIFRIREREVTPEFKRKTHRLVEQAVGLVERKGVSALGLRALAGDKSPATVQNYFGTQRGLFAAVAASGFQTLGWKLSRASATLHARAAVHLDFGLGFQGWYTTMHSPLVWRAATEDAVEDRPAEVEGQWLVQARAARDEAFNHFVDAARQEGFAGDKAEKVAQMVTALVDGYLFQVREEGEADDRARGLELLEMATRNLHA